MESADVTDRLLHGASDQVLTLACPNCSGQLKVGFHRGRRLMAAKVECKKCDYCVRMDGLPTEPPWVAQLGTEFETRPEMESG